MEINDYKKLEELVQNDILECRRLFAKSVSYISKNSTLEERKKDFPKLLIECFKVHKTALRILIDRISYIENLIAQANIKNAADSRNLENAKLSYLKWLLELTFNTFVWVSVGMDRSNIRKVFKCPKYGDLTHQNIQSLLGYVNEINKTPNEIAIPLDFCSFSSICDVLKISYSESDQVLHTDFIEAKSGKVNDAIFETIQSKTKDAYFRFFDSYGKNGINQMGRVFRQRMMLEKNLELINAVPGVYENPANPEEKIHIMANEVPSHYFADKITQLLEKADRNEFAVDEVDHCLIFGIINAKDEKMAMVGEFDLRLYVYHSFINPATINGAPYPPDLHVILDTIKLTDWREGFISVILDPIILRNIPDQYLMDLLFGRKILKLCFNPQRFVSLCNHNGIKTDLANRRETSRLKSTGLNKRAVDFGGRFIRLYQHDHNWIFGEGLYHDMLFNWIYPTSIIEREKQCTIQDKY